MTMVVVEFRDGEQLVPWHVGQLMKGLETHKMTYEAAIHLANQRLIRIRLDQAQRDLVNAHFRQGR